jgi:lysophospholipase L1-like esterase
MARLIYLCAGGLTFFPGAGLMIIAAVISLWRSGKWAKRSSILLAILGVAMVLVSAEAIPLWLDGIWLAAILAWFMTVSSKRRRPVFVASWLAIIIATIAVGVAIPYHISPRISLARGQPLYVVGDSISAGLDVRNDLTWPLRLAADHSVQVFDLSRAGCTIPEARQRVQREKLSSGIIILEIGGNDMLSRVKPAQFASDLDALIQKIQSPSRRIVLFELPLFPFDNAYGIEQRRIARKYHAALIPRRYFANVLATPGATVDGIHLSPAGQQMTADLVWEIIGS